MNRLSQLSDSPKTLDEWYKETGGWYQPQPGNDTTPQDESRAFTRGLKTALKQIPQTGAGLVAMGGNALANITDGDFGKGVMDWGLKKYKEYEGEIGALQRPDESFTGVFTGESDIGRGLGHATGYVAGQALTALGTGGVGGLVGKQLARSGAKTLGSKLGSAGALGASNLMQEAGSIYPTAVDVNDGQPLNNDQLLRAGGSAVGAAGLETFADMVGLGTLTKALSGSVTGAINAVGGGMLREGATEVAQTAMERYGANQSLSDNEAQRDYIESGLLGAYGGGLVGGGAKAIGSISNALTKLPDQQHISPMVEQSQSAEQTQQIKKQLAQPSALDDVPFAPQIEIATQKQNPPTPMFPSADKLDQITNGDGVTINDNDFLAPLDKPAVSSTMQNRDRSRPASVQQIAEIAGNPDYDRLGFGRLPDGAAPMVSVAANAQSIPSNQMGNIDRVVIGKNQKIPIRYAVVEADSVLVSHDNTGNENRAYNQPAQVGQIRALNNGRTAGLQKAYEVGTANDYRQNLINDATNLGITPDVIASMKKPVLVRVYDDRENERMNIGALSNAASGLGLSATERAKTDSRFIDFEKFADDPSLDSMSNREAITHFIVSMQKAGQDTSVMQSASGGFTKQFYDRMQNAMYWKAYNNNKLLDLVAEDANPDLKSLSNALMSNAKGFATLPESAQKFKDVIVDATIKYRHAVQQGKDRDVILSTPSMFENDDLPREIAKFIAANSRRMNVVKTWLKHYVDILHANVNQGDMFGASEPVDVNQAIEYANTNTEKDYEQHDKPPTTVSNPFANARDTAPSNREDNERSPRSGNAQGVGEQAQSASLFGNSLTQSAQLIGNPQETSATPPLSGTMFSHSPNKNKRENKATAIQTAIKAALGDRASKINVVSREGVKPIGAQSLTNDVEGFFNPETGEINIIADNIKATGNMSREDRAVWVAWHEMFHRGMATGAMQSNYAHIINTAHDNALVRKLADAINQDRKGKLSKGVAIEEALAELRAAMETGDWQHLNDRYGVSFNNLQKNIAKSAVQKFIEAVRKFIAQVLGIKSNPTDAEIMDLVRKIADHDTGELVGGSGENKNMVNFSTKTFEGKETEQIDEDYVRINDALVDMGLYTNVSYSAKSKSRYIDVSNGNSLIKIRISDHDLPIGYNRADYDVSTSPDRNMTDGDWLGAIKYVADTMSVEMPANIKEMYDESRANIKLKNEINELVRQNDIKAADVLNQKTIGVKRELLKWMESLPNEAIYRVSKRGKLNAIVNGDTIVFGDKPFGMQNNISSKSDLENYINSYPSIKKDIPVAEDNVKKRPQAGESTQSNISPSQGEVTTNEDTENYSKKFLPVNHDIRYSTAPKTADQKFVRNANANATQFIKDTLAGYATDIIGSKSNFGVLAKTIQTQQHKAKTNPLFGKVYERAQSYINDVQQLSMEASDGAYLLLPQFGSGWQSIKDMVKTLVTGGKAYSELKKDRAVVAKIIHEGTLNFWRDNTGKLFRTSNVEQAGVVFTDGELLKFGLTDKQIEMYRQYRTAIDTSLNQVAISTIARISGVKVDKHSQDLEGVADDVMSIVSMQEHSGDLMQQIKEIRDKTLELQGKGYAPLMRYGKYYVSVRENEELVNYQMFESRAEANKAVRELTSEYAGAKIEQGELSEKQHEMFEGLSPESLELFADVLSSSKILQGAENEVMQEYIRHAVAQRSAIKRHMHRSGYEGFSENVSRNLASFITSNARLASKNYHMGEMTKAVQAIKTKSKGNEDGMNEYRGGSVMDEAISLVRYVQNPQEENNTMRGLLFVNYLGGSIASAAINLTQTIMMTIPFLNQYSSIRDIGSMLGRYSKLSAIATSGGEIIITDHKIKQAYNEAKRNGVVSPHDFYSLQAEAIGNLDKGSLFLKQALNAWGGLFSAAETFNRHMSFLMAAEVAQKMGDAKLKTLGFNNIYDFAVNATMETQGVYNRANRPNWARGAVGATIFTFKQYSIQYIELMSRLPRRQQVLMLGTLIFMGGLNGAPGADDLDDIIDTIGQKLGYNTNASKWKRDFLKSFLGESGANVVLQGVMGNTGVMDASGRIGMGNLLPATGLFKPSEKNRTGQALELLGVGGSYINNAASFAAGDKGISTFAPVAIANLLKSIDMFQTGMYRDGAGRKVMDTNFTDAIVKGIGFMPAEVGRNQRIISENMSTVDFAKKRESEIVKNWANAILTGDKDGVQDAITSLRRWNEKNPTTPIRINMSQVMAAVNARRMTTEQRFIKQAPKEVRNAIL